MRRGVGIAGIQAAQQRQAAARSAGQQLNSDLLKNLKTQTGQFQAALETFARKHRDEIQRNPEFRAQFHTMCAAVGVDPLTTAKGAGLGGRGLWAEMIPMGSFYNELGVRVVEVCLSTRGINGGVLEVGELVRRLAKRRITFSEKISTDDVERAVRKLKVLGSGFDVIKLGKKVVIRSVPTELNPDQTLVLQIAEQNGCVTETECVERLRWDRSRVQTALSYLLEREIAWADDQDTAKGERVFWFLGLVKGSAEDSGGGAS